MTTCGLTAVGAPCEDEGELLPLHGRVSNIPAESISTEITNEDIIIKARINHSRIFSEKLILERKIKCSLLHNRIGIIDTVKNNGDKKSPIMILYHFNIGYPLLSQGSRLSINSKKVTPRDDHAKTGINSWNEIIPPKAGFVEQCYYHEFDKEGTAAIYNPEIGKGRITSYNVCYTKLLRSVN